MNGDYLLVASLVGLLLVQLLKSDAIPINIPAGLRPVVATTLAAITAICLAILQDADWRQALVPVFLASAASPGIHALATRPFEGAKKDSSDG